MSFVNNMSSIELALSFQGIDKFEKEINEFSSIEEGSKLGVNKDGRLYQDKRGFFQDFSRFVINILNAINISASKNDNESVFSKIDTLENAFRFKMTRIQKTLDESILSREDRVRARYELKYLEERLQFAHEGLQRVAETYAEGSEEAREFRARSMEMGALKDQIHGMNSDLDKMIALRIPRELPVPPA